MRKIKKKVKLNILFFLIVSEVSMRKRKKKKEKS
jgi:hypothetical protein